MKKLLIGVLTFLSVAAQAQISTPTQQPAQLSSTSSISTQVIQASSSYPTPASGTVIFSETFSNGLLGDGNNGFWTVYGTPSTATWEYRGTSTTPDFTMGSRGAYATNQGPIQSATTSNGFFIFDSDYLDNGGVAGNFGQGSSPSPHTGYFESPTIDLSSYGGAYIQISSYYRRFMSNANIQFSTNGGSSWPYTINLYGDNNAIYPIATNASTSTNDVTATYLPTGIAGNPNVKFRFVFDGTPSNANGSGYYYWMIDDVKLIDSPHHDLETSQIYFNGIADSNSYGYTYKKIPVRQAQSFGMTLGSTHHNKGSYDQTSVSTKVKVSGVSNTLLSSSATIPVIASGTSDSINTGVFTPNTGIGTYKLDFYSNADSLDQVPSNDTMSYSFDVTANQYSWTDTADIGYFPIGGTSTYEICSKFDFTANDTVVGMQVEFYHNLSNTYNNLVPGIDMLQFRIIDATQFNSNNQFTGTNIAEYNQGTTSYTVVPADLGNIITVPITHKAATPTILPGSYFACVKTSNHNVFIMSDSEKSQQYWRPGTTLADNDNQNNWNGFRITPSITVLTKMDSIQCASFNLSGVTTAVDSAFTGSITAVANGGMAPYTYNWTSPSGNILTGDSLVGLTQSGIYSLTITDINGCSSPVLNQNLMGCVGLTNVSLTANKTNASGPGQMDGAIDITTNGGSGNFIFNWTGPNGYSATTEDISSLGAGSYTITVSDAQCPAILDSMTLSIVDTNNSTPCTGVVIQATTAVFDSIVTNGSIHVTSTIGGTAPYVYVWTYPNGTVANGNPITGLSQAGNYTLVIIDANGCSSTPHSVSYGLCTGIAPLTVSATQTDVSVPGASDGAVDLTVSGGTGAYNYSWTSMGGFSATTQDINGIPVGFYFVTVSDAQCPQLDTVLFFNIANYTPCNGVVVSATITEDETSQTNGSISLVPSGGTAPYTYDWTFPDGSTHTGDSQTGLSIAGDYQILITDSLGCTSPLIIHNLAGCVGLQDLVYSAIDTDLSGTGASDGAIDVTLSGGSGNYAFYWTGPNGYSNSTEDITGLDQGTYHLVAVDSMCPTLLVNDSFNLYVTSIRDITLAAAIQLYPNPNRGTFTVEVEGANEVIELRVMNVVGQMVHGSTIENANYKEQIHLNAQAGLYFIELKSKSGKKEILKMIVH